MTTLLVLFINFSALLFLIFFSPLAKSVSLDSKILWHALTFTVSQGALSATFCLIVGLISAPGYARLRRLRRFSRWVLLLPSFMSPVLVVLSLLTVFPKFPFGLTGIILGHIFLNGGLACVWLGEKWLELEQKWGPVNQVLGGGTSHYFFKGILPQMNGQIFNSWAVLFSLCLCSFAIPLVLGGGPQNSTLEVLIFERIHTDADTSGAITLSLVQCALQFVVFVLILKPLLLKTEQPRQVQWTGQISGWILPTIILCSLSMIPLLSLIKMGISETSSSLYLDPEFLTAMRNSVVVGLGVGLLSFALLCLLVTWGWDRLTPSIPALSGIAVGMAGLLIFKTWKQNSTAPLLLGLIWGHLSVISLPVFRLCSPNLEQLRLQFEKVFQQIGTGQLFSFKKVYLNLGMKTYLAGAVLAGCWSMGEFSVSRMMSPGDNTLPLYIHGLLSSYRLEAAAGASLILFLLSVITMSLFEVFTHGLG